MSLKTKFLVLVASVSSVSALAFPIVPETGNTYASAYALSGFTTSFDANIENSTTQLHSSVTGHNNATTDVDWFTFTAVSGSSLILDIDTDNHGGIFDTTLMLFDFAGSLLSQSDDDGYDAGSTTGSLYFYDSRLYYTATYTGLYAVAVSNYSNFADGNPFGVSTGSGGYNTGGGYDLHVSTTPASVPDSASSLALMGLGVAMIGMVRRKLSRA